MLKLRYNKVVSQKNSDMNVKIFTLLGMIVLFAWSCGSDSPKVNVSENAVVQESDGTFSLNLDDAACYSDAENPESNTAEWKVVVSEPGTYKVWLTSATRDTTDLSYINSVRISLSDKLIEVDPAIDRVVLDSKEVSLPYYRADSYAGSFYFSEPGEYSIQVISEKILPKEAMNTSREESIDTKLVSVILTPLTR